MQILIDVRLLSRGGMSGIEEYTQQLLKAIFDLDKENRYSLFYNGFRKQPLNLTPHASRFTIHDWHAPNKFLDFSNRFLNFPKIDRLIKTDLVFSPHFNFLKTAAAPRIITFHDLSFLHHPYFFSARQRFWHWLQDIKKQAQAADRLIAVSEFTKSDLVNLLGVPEEKISVIYSGISSDFKVLPKPHSLNFKPYILYLGTLEPRKNVLAIIRAFNLIKKDPAFANWQLVLAGRPGWLYQNILKEVRQSPNAADIILHGAVGGEERVLLYNLAKVFVYPSFFEGFGFPPLEAQACGCPAVVADRTSLPEVVGNSALLVNPWKVDDLAGAIREVALNSRLREKLIAAGRANVAKFSWEKTARETIKIFNGQ